jgi:hypothetical protein
MCGISLDKCNSTENQLQLGPVCKILFTLKNINDKVISAIHSCKHLELLHNNTIPDVKRLLNFPLC